MIANNNTPVATPALAAVVVLVSMSWQLEAQGKGRPAVQNGVAVYTTVKI